MMRLKYQCCCCVYSNCHRLSAFCLSLNFSSLCSRMARWSSAGKELSSWFSPYAVLYLILVLSDRVPFLFGVLGRRWNSVVSVPGCGN